VNIYLFKVEQLQQETETDVVCFSSRAIT